MERRNLVRLLEYEHEGTIRNDIEMAETAKGYFEDLFTSNGGDCDLGHVLSGIDRCISDEDNLLLIAPYSDEDIIHALKKTGPTKALGVYGFPTFFFQKY